MSHDQNNHSGWFIRSLKNRGRTTHQPGHMSGKATKVDILKNEAQSKVEYSEKTSCFELKVFSNASRKFSVSFTTIFRVSGRSA